MHNQIHTFAKRLRISAKSLLLQAKKLRNSESAGGSVRAFLTECEAAGRSLTTAHYLYVNGQNAEGIKISVQDHLRRGASLIRLSNVWLEMWEFVNM